MSCTNDSPCRQPMLRWVHSRACLLSTEEGRWLKKLAERLEAKISVRGVSYEAASEMRPFIDELYARAKKLLGTDER